MFIFLHTTLSLPCSLPRRKRSNSIGGRHPAIERKISVTSVLSEDSAVAGAAVGAALGLARMNSIGSVGNGNAARKVSRESAVAAMAAGQVGSGIIGPLGEFYDHA